MSEIKDSVRRYILDNFLMGGDAERLTDSASFMDQRVIDSTGFLELVTYLEETFGIQVLDEEMIPENLDSLENIDAYVRRKKAA